MPRLLRASESVPRTSRANSFLLMDSVDFLGEVRAASCRPFPQSERFQARTIRAHRDGHLSFRDELCFETFEQGHPQTALARSVPPVAVNRAARTLAFAHHEEAAALAAAGLLRRVVQREMPLESLAVRLDEVDAVLVRPTAIAPLAVPLDPLHGSRGVGVACVPDAGSGLILTEQHVANVREHVES